ncbi:MAG: type IX secretion system membrane protein PorP/SprF, partial [Bacteroidia bacterium]
MKKITIALMGLALGLPLNAQMGVRLDQFYMDHASIIPAAVGNMEMGGLSLFHNKMFSDVPGSPQHSVMNVNMPMASKNTGFGIYYMRERYGFAETHNTYATYAYTIGLGNAADLSLGVSVGALRQSFDP